MFTCWYSHQSRLAFLQQKVTIGGLKSELYDQEQEALQCIMEAGIQVSPLRVDGTCNPTLGTFLTISNRVFMSKCDAEWIGPRTLSSDVDPYGTLSTRARSAGLVHSADNVVSYVRRCSTGLSYVNLLIASRASTTSRRLDSSPITPASFREGDIVLAQFAIAMFASADNESLIPKLLLRTLISVDTSFSRVRVWICNGSTN